MNNNKERKSDGELIAAIKKGQTEEFEQLFLRYLPLTKKLSNMYYFKYLEEEDYLQESRMVFFKALQQFVEGKGHTFGNFYKLNLKHHLFSLIRKENAKKRGADRLSDSLDEMLENNHAPKYIANQEEQVTAYDKMMISENVTAYYDTLSSFERHVFNGYLANLELEEIAKNLDCELLKVRNALDRCRQKLRKSFDG
ncbi:sigma-70 family RNA polymerase sigma factor [Carnobacterium divergens]|uniref:sigma-70 family RNA polymerase sigma factor n=1 Tax=Carnobacterium divergens TaxID=2748 RepID=UPI0007F44CD2|nr:sigma-70 family RNA polymerase sigma factor [Carnobacterium divergens]SBO17042.1 Sigma-70 factor family protein [Carnobacterium divergens]